ncbi:putative phage-like protein YoqJ [Paenibacillus rhizosphaerae]|uniref:Putative phage-like protein YoqJ n=1 Tax=Paenibacillus rhizosphaerae TaxID=297318 RepID=A0A839TXY5_9BACL|nr:DUF1273 domain-containing protein [Paenibacillus rhizosphaerae]MBB3131502.1 putative phage-like protein YoqJ [Paenibacillus rhizosphaerae]
MKNCLVTGYRAHELNIFGQKHPGIPYIKQAITAKLIPLLEEGLEWVITPGQYGVDLWGIEAAIALREQYPELKCSIISAFASPEEKWKEDKQEYYRQILREIDYYGVVSNQPYSGPWQFAARDDLLFRKTDGIVLVYDEDAGEGTGRFYKERALKKQQEEGYEYINISSEDIQSMVGEAVHDMDSEVDSFFGE